MSSIEKLTPLVIFQTVIRLIILNSLFLISNLPAVIIIFLTGIENISTPSPLLMIASLTLGPSFIALFKSFYRMLEQSDTSVYRVFALTYCQGFSKDIVPFILVQFILFILSYSQLAFQLVPALALLSPLYFIINYIAIMMLVFLSQELALFENSFKNTLKNSFILIFMRPFMSLFIIAYGIFSLLVINEFPASLLIFTFSLFVFLFVSFSFRACQTRVKDIHY